MTMLSFIIPAHNEEGELPETLRALRAAAEEGGQPYEVIVVDDASTDNTRAIAESFGARVIAADYRQIAAVRNAGARAARGDVFFFVDADTQIAAVHIKGALRALEDGAAGGGARLELTGSVPRYGRILARVFCTIYFAAKLGAGAFLFTTRETFERIGGFDEQYFAGEEIFFTRALKEVGRFELLSFPVRTSARKLRMNGGSYMLRQILMLGFSGERALRSRKRLAIWYDGRREAAPAEQV